MANLDSECVFRLVPWIFHRFLKRIVFNTLNNTAQVTPVCPLNKFHILCVWFCFSMDLRLITYFRI